MWQPRSRPTPTRSRNSRTAPAPQQRRPRRPAGHCGDGDWAAADEAHIAYGLSSWHPTDGTRIAGKVTHRRRNGRRVRYANGQLEYRTDNPPTLKWPFPDPMGTREVVGEFTMADAVTAPLAVEAVHRILTGQIRTTGVASAGEIFDAPDFLRALPSHISVRLCP